MDFKLSCKHHMYGVYLFRTIYKKKIITMFTKDKNLVNGFYNLDQEIINETINKIILHQKTKK